MYLQNLFYGMSHGPSNEQYHYIICCTCIWLRGHRGRDRMVVRFTTIYVISAYHHSRCEFESSSWRDVLDTTLCNKVCQWLM